MPILQLIAGSWQLVFVIIGFGVFIIVMRVRADIRYQTRQQFEANEAAAAEQRRANALKIEHVETKRKTP